MAEKDSINLEEIKKNKTIKELLEFGIINIDKPSGPTSFSVSEFVMKKLKLRKTSHFGTLDPKVTGVLPIALNRACKLTGYFLGEDKEYVGIMRIHKPIKKSEIQKVIDEKFIGKISQMPPVKSRVKRQIRKREIKKFELIEQSEDLRDILFKAEVEGGTYIRKLIHDLGEEMRIGMHMLELRRTKAGVFSEEGEYPCVTLYDFEKAVDEYEKGNEELLRKIIIPAEIVSKIYPIVRVKKESSEKILHGKPIYHSEISEEEKEKVFETGKIISVFSDNKFIGIFEVINAPNVFAKPRFVLQPI